MSSCHTYMMATIMLRLLHFVSDPRISIAYYMCMFLAKRNKPFVTAWGMHGEFCL